MIKSKKIRLLLLLLVVVKLIYFLIFFSVGPFFTKYLIIQIPYVSKKYSNISTKDFTQEKLNSVLIGMSKTDVRQLLGLPYESHGLHGISENENCDIYSKPSFIPLVVNLITMPLYIIFPKYDTAVCYDLTDKVFYKGDYDYIY